MLTATDLKTAIETHLTDAHAQVLGDDGVHFEAVVQCPSFAGLGMLKQHQQVYGALAAAGLRMGQEIHALALKTGV